MKKMCVVLSLCLVLTGCNSKSSKIDETLTDKEVYQKLKFDNECEFDGYKASDYWSSVDIVCGDDEIIYYSSDNYFKFYWMPDGKESCVLKTNGELDKSDWADQDSDYKKECNKYSQWLNEMGITSKQLVKAINYYADEIAEGF